VRNLSSDCFVVSNLDGRQEHSKSISLFDVELEVTYLPSRVDAVKRESPRLRGGSGRAHGSSQLLSIQWAAYSGAVTLVDRFSL
jgi:hypothetical protein